MQQAWSNVESLLLDMKPLLVEAGVPERQVKMPANRPADEIKIDQYTKAFDWLHLLYTSPEWEALVKAKAQLPQNVWDRYKAHRITGLEEQKILEAAQLGIRRAWKINRPSFFGRVYKERPDGD